MEKETETERGSAVQYASTNVADLHADVESWHLHSSRAEGGE